ncbi:MAG: hypothetical protein KBF21_07740 [Thermoanaerobaculia bacterium]|nr:hypothetical protein [Thermoanaerobaculia bacterium]MBP9824098.1 hypothetical protein [Thermoanaerobaculia bacterium]
MRSLALAFLSSLMLAPALFASPPTPDPAKTALAAEVQALRQNLATLAAEVAALKAAATPGLEARVAATEAELAKFGAALAGVETRLAELSESQAMTAETLGSIESAETRAIHLTTYGTFAVEDTSRSNSTFDAESLELVLSAQPHPRLGLFAELEFERAAAVGGERGGEVLLEQAWASFRLTDWMSLRAGALLVPFGNVNVDHYAPNRDVISKPLVSYVVAPSDWTDNGLGLSGTVLLGGEWVLRYDTAVVAGLDEDVTALGTRAARQPFGADNNNNKALVGRLGWKYGGAFELGMSGYDGAYDDDGQLPLSGWAVDALAVVGPLRLTGEFDHFAAGQAVGPDARLEGWYVRAALDLFTRLLRSGRHGELFPEARVSLVGQVERVDLAGPLEGTWEENSEERLTLGLNYRPASSWVLKLDREWRRAPDRALVFGDEEAWLGSIGFVF